jgi:superfamily II DNA/RNA helicase
MSQADRTQVIQDLRAGKSRILISSDLVGRGIDVQSISLVINYDLPINREQFIHRVGRAGRFAPKGVAIPLVAPDDVSVMRDIETFFNIQIDELSSNFALLL